jgi:hypothetical protein
MRDLGLLHWQRRLVRAAWRAEQSSNQYVLISPAAEPAPRVPRCGGQTGRETRSRCTSPLLSPREQDAAARAAARQQLLALGFPVPAGW